MSDEEEIPVSMSPQVRAEYVDALRVAVLRHGTLVEPHPSPYGWMDHDYGHTRACQVFSDATPTEATWTQFCDTFSPNSEHHGVELTGVSCACGRLRDRTLRWEAAPSELIETVLTHALDRVRRLESRIEDLEDDR